MKNFTCKSSKIICPALHLAVLPGRSTGLFVWSMCLMALGFMAARGQETQKGSTDAADAPTEEAQFLTQIRQLTFEGRRAGEGYFSADGSRLVFQSEREPGNPFFQIYLLSFDTGDTIRVSPGRGKTTCAWIHPNGTEVLFASTHNDPRTDEVQRQEIDRRKSGNERRYSWDYDPSFDLYVFDTKTKSYTNLTKQIGYDAEGSFSPDGKLIAFASNRAAYDSKLAPDEAAKFEIDPSWMMDLYIMNADGTNVRRLTDVPGYDGGPFFSPDGQRICWRRFSENGATAEILTMRIDGTDVRQLTHMGAMSWAPFYHPSGEYLIFTTNRHGFANFELYLVDKEGKSDPVRVTQTAGFDGLPAFSPDGTKLAWTSNRTSNNQSQIFLAEWNHERAIERLRGAADAIAQPPRAGLETDTNSALTAGRETARKTSSSFSPEDILRHVDYLCRPELAGRRTGTAGEQLATAYVAAYFDQIGLEPAGENGSWYQPFEFTSGVALGQQNRLVQDGREWHVERDWLPLAFSSTGSIEPGPMVFAGYGIVAPATEDQAEYDSYVHLDVHNKWVMMFRFMPENVSPERRQYLARHASLRYKTMVARDRQAKGVIVVSGPNSGVKKQLIQLEFDGSLAGTSIPVISVTDDVASTWLGQEAKSLQDVQDQFDSGEPAMGFELKVAPLGGHIDIQQVRRTGRNVLGRLPGAGPEPRQTILIGAHVDHLGKGTGASSLARDDERDAIHFGADDNASGVAAMLEIAEFLSSHKSSGSFQPARDILFAAWSGEEIGLIGSSHFVKTWGDRIYPDIAACLNLDMVGRLEKKLILQGAGSSSVWRGEIERRNAVTGLPITIQDDSYLPTDASSFFVHGVPILSAFTGTHSEYHTPRDTPDRLNYDGAAKISRLMALIAQALSTRAEPPDYIEQKGPAEGQRRAQLRAYLGTIPDYAESDIKGVKLSGASKGGPADAAGIRQGDVIVELAGKKVENIYDYTYAIEALKIGQPVKIVVLRGDERLELKIVPGSRD
jgi:Tol biopolymer transport system component